MPSYSQRSDDLDVRVRQSNALDDGDDNLNRALIDQQLTSNSHGSHGYGSHSRGNDNDADVDQDIDSGGNRQNNDLRISDPEARDDLVLDIGQSNTMYDDDRNTNYANIEQSVARGGSHHGLGSHGGDNDADVDQDIDSGGNHQSNRVSFEDARADDDLRLTLDQSNSMDDGDRNGNFAEISQEFANSGGGSHSYGGRGGHGGSDGDNDADVDQDIDSGGNHQKNYADLDDLNARGDLNLKLGQSNTMYDDDINTNGASIEQRGGNNWADLDQKIDSGGNSQENNADFDPGSMYSSRGGHDSSHGGNHGDDVTIDLSQRNTMDDGDDNMNDAEITQVGGRGADNDADVWQKIDSGDNTQRNYADLDNIGVRGDLEVKASQSNTMYDDDLNTNGADIDQRGGDNWADLDQKIDSGGNSQKNNLDFDPDSGPSYGRGGSHGGGYGSDETKVDIVQRNSMDDGDDNLNSTDIAQVASRGSDNDANIWQKIDSGGNTQKNYADLDLSSRGAAGEYDVEQVNWMADDDVNTNHAGVTQHSVDNWADVDQVIDSGGNSQHNSLDLDFG